MFKKKIVEVKEKPFSISDYPKESEQVNHIMMKSKQLGEFYMSGMTKTGTPKHSQLTFNDVVNNSRPIRDLIVALGKINDLEDRLVALEKQNKKK